MKYSIDKKRKIIVLNHMKKYIDQFSKKNSKKIFKFYHLPIKIYDIKRYNLQSKLNFFNYFNLVYFFLRQNNYKFTKIVSTNIKINKEVFKVNLLAKRYFKIKKTQKLKLIYNIIFIKNKPKITGFKVIHD